MFGWAMLRPHLPGGMRVCKPEQAEPGLLNCLYTADLAGTLWCIVLGNSLVSLNQPYIELVLAKQPLVTGVKGKFAKNTMKQQQQQHLMPHSTFTTHTSIHQTPITTVLSTKYTFSFS